LAKTPEERFANTDELLYALRERAIAASADETLVNPAVAIPRTVSAAAGRPATGGRQARVFAGAGAFLVLAASVILFFLASGPSYENSRNDPRSTAQLTTDEPPAAGTSSDNAVETPDRRIDQLLAEGQKQWRAQKFTDPPGDNAFETYRQVLELAPNHQRARDRLLELGRMRLGAQYLDSARTLYERGDWERSLDEAKTGLRLSANHSGLAVFRDRIQLALEAETEQDRERRRIDRLLNQAQAQWQAGKFTEPVGDNAFESYRQVLELRPGHNTARAKLVEIGRLRLGRQYQRDAEQLLQRGAFDEGIAKIEAGLRVAPNFAGLVKLKEKALQSQNGVSP
jgi:hypothetical protein